MNGIIHNCTHNDDDPTMVLTEEQMFTGIMRYIDQLFEVIQPRKIFYMAVDGVAPRAKMNQQRTRRFKSKREAEEKALQINNSKGRGAQHNQPGTIVADNSFDSNCITPGTEMMARLSAHLKYYIALRIKEDVRWRSIKIIFSGYEVFFCSSSVFCGLISCVVLGTGRGRAQNHVVYPLPTIKTRLGPQYPSLPLRSRRRLDHARPALSRDPFRAPS